MNQKMVALHGFLGCPTDWDIVQNVWMSHEQSISIVAPNLNSDPLLKPQTSMKDWAKTFCKWVKDQGLTDSILLGYSMGGRLALHALIEEPQIWKAAMIVSANPGLEHEHDRISRLQHDQEWANRFLTQEWKSLMKQWNEQAVLRNSNSRSRNENDFDRTVLASMLDQWSLGRQEFLLPNLINIGLPIKWFVGKTDLMSGKIKALIKKSEAKIDLVEIGCGHRIPWDQRQIFIEEVQRFFNCLL